MKADPSSRRRTRRRRRPDPFSRRLRRSLRPPRALKPTRAGWAFFALTLGVGFASLNTGNNLLYMVLSILLAFLVLSGVFSEAALRGVRVRRRLPREVFADQPARIVIEVENSKAKVPSYAIVVEEMLGEGIEQAVPAGRTFFFHVPAGERVARVQRFTPEQRGDLAFAGFRVWTRFPFGLFAKAMTLEAPDQLLVYPGLDPAALVPGNVGDAQRGESEGGTGGDSPEAAGLREYDSGDSFRRIHWPNTLRRGTLLVRDREREHQAELVVRLATARPGGPGFEAEVRRATSEAVAHLEAGWRVGLRTEELYLPPAQGERHRRELLATLARIEPTAIPASRTPERAA